MSGPRGVSAALIVLLLTGALAGCVDLRPAATFQDAGAAADVPPYAAIDESKLSKPTFGVLPAIDTRITASIDGISLFAEVYLPDGEGTWPTILHSTPYKHLDVALALALGYGLVDTYVPRGYAVVLADVRGYGDSEGCVEVWGPNEQQDQYDLVEWIAEQPWSDGKVGMIGASYPGTTPIEAAVMAPPHLVTIVAAAGLTDPYFDWHFGGVPSGESSPRGSPTAYQAIGAAPPIEPTADPLAWARANAAAGCGTPELVTGAWQQDSVYTEFYEVRNFSARVKNIQASVLYTQGFTDGNVKPWQLMHFFNEIDAPKKGFFGQWAHRFPARDDYQTFEIAWFDHWLKGIDTGVMNGPTAEIITNLDTWRGDSAFPNNDLPRRALHLDASSMTLSFDAPTSEGEATYYADRRPYAGLGPTDGVEGALRAATGGGQEELRFVSAPLESDLYMSGVVHLDLHAVMDAPNAYLFATLYEIEGNERRSIVYGGLAAALREGYAEYKPVPEGEVVPYRLSFQPREYVVEKGVKLELVLRTSSVFGTMTTEAMGPVRVSVLTGPELGSALDVPVLPARVDAPLPWE